MWYTGKGDDGRSKTLRGARERKDAPLFEALGTVDELNAYLGLVRAQLARSTDAPEDERVLPAVLRSVQEDLFLVQAELAGADKRIDQARIEDIERIIAQCEEEVPPITSFVIPGADMQAAALDLARTIARRAERRVVALPKEKLPAPLTLMYLNRLSSLFYARARVAAHRAGVKEQGPHYGEAS